MTKIAIIGAGLSGLTAAHLLKEHCEVTIFEKSRGVGGRMSTRRAQPYFFDHGAQYFTAKTKPFQTFIQPFLDQGIIEKWNAHCVIIDSNNNGTTKSWNDDTPRYVGVPGMNNVAKFLAKDIDIQSNTRIVTLSYQDRWQLMDEQEQQFEGFDWVISTIPSPQAAQLLPHTFAFHKDIELTKMIPCFALMLGFEKDLPIEFDAAQVTNSDLSWIAVNSHKPQRPSSFTLMVHSTAEFAEAHIDHDRQNAMEHLIGETGRITGYNVSEADYKTLHGWRYANVAQREQTNTVFLDQDHKLAVCGDWCSGGRVEGAFMSAYNLAEKLKAVAL
ncbi:MAG: FAD-dependent oxidoreductase [Lentilitoribacter sp.]